jgi:2-polyprenyl-3-methyl-5-hydroxy-6-metoxy-1,4-benzoquinol methylase
MSALESLERREIRVCDNCGSMRFVVYGVTIDALALHPVQCRCLDCGLVFATPRITPVGLRDYYRRYEVSGANDPASERKREAGARRTIDELQRYVPRGRLLDVGSGTGTVLAAARDAGYEVAGVELSQRGVELARGRHGIEVFHGSISDAAFPDGSFDVVHAWHVIEHVFDLDEFVGELRRVLRVGGMLAIGTESYAYPANALLRAGRFLRGRVPRTVTSTEHTFVFSPATLTDCLGRRGFEPSRLIAYDELSFRERLEVTGATSAARRVGACSVAALGWLLARSIRRGPYLRGYFSRLP